VPQHLPTNTQRIYPYLARERSGVCSPLQETDKKHTHTNIHTDTHAHTRTHTYTRTHAPLRIKTPILAGSHSALPVFLWIERSLQLWSILSTSDSSGSQGAREHLVYGCLSTHSPSLILRLPKRVCFLFMGSFKSPQIVPTDL
jgi:hypothetical protein